MGWLDLLFGLGSPPRERDQAAIDREAARLADGARGADVTRGVLANRDGRTDAPIVVYLEEDEQPHYVFVGSGLLIGDEDGSLRREYPTRKSQVVVSDRRLLFLVGNRRSDDLWEVPFDDVRGAYVDDESWRRHLVVEADREGHPMTFYADVTLNGNPEGVRDGLEYVLEASSVDG